LGQLLLDEFPVAPATHALELGFSNLERAERFLEPNPIAKVTIGEAVLTKK